MPPGSIERTQMRVRDPSGAFHACFCWLLTPPDVMFVQLLEGLERVAVERMTSTPSSM
jgi:hypothetical protein